MESKKRYRDGSSNATSAKPSASKVASSVSSSHHHDCQTTPSSYESVTKKKSVCSKENTYKSTGPNKSGHPLSSIEKKNNKIDSASNCISSESSGTKPGPDDLEALYNSSQKRQKKSTSPYGFSAYSTTPGFSSNSSTDSLGLECEESLNMNEIISGEGLFEELGDDFDPNLEATEELNAFEELECPVDENASVIDTETLTYLIKQDSLYSADPFYFETKQNQITWSMRVILLDWMMEVAMEFTLKRETFHYSINYVDRYLSSEENLPKKHLQLLGVSALFIASKIEEIYPPKITDFVRATSNAYSSEAIQDMEYKIFSALSWYVIPVTANTWANWYMNQWDLYIEGNSYAQSHRLMESLPPDEQSILFKHTSEKSYMRFREMMQLMDVITLDFHSLKHNSRSLVASLLYLILAKHFGYLIEDDIEDEIINSENFMTEDSSYNDLFSHFLSTSFGFMLDDIVLTVRYAATFMNFQLSFELPTVLKTRDQKEVLEGHYEEFLAYQTHHPCNIEFIRDKPSLY
eukprot:CAMPEP_0115028848 /NCGR_PEP_ID=MMETSP0216-20121206/36597_1 /TAXON_ID=223996 /ORGANISM="Protocruzia adherens, Strain Boccale" /LENGTH=520 /DNA_ID=CAMNT_0002405215 /DNA_START=1 /DNA_END=1563 /DNA_ORIENTATION=+